MLVPVSVWGHHIFPCLLCPDILALRGTCRALRDSIPTALIDYEHWLLSETQFLSSLPSLQDFREQIFTIVSLAKAELAGLVTEDVIEAAGFYHPPQNVLDTAQTAMLLFAKPESNSWLCFLRNAQFLLRWLRDFDPLTPFLLQHLQTFEAYLTSHDPQDMQKMWKFAGCFHRYLEHIVHIGKLRNESRCEGLELKLRMRLLQLEAVEKLQESLSKGLK